MRTQRIKPKKKTNVQRLHSKALQASPKKDEHAFRKECFFKLKKLLPDNIPLPLSGLLCFTTGMFYLDMFELEKLIPNYDGMECTYKGKPNYSMKMAIEEEWGKEVSTLIKNLL